MKHKPKYLIEYIAFRIVAAIVKILPYRFALIFAWVAARFAFHVIRFRVSRAKARIVEVFGDKYSSREISHIAWISLRNVFFSAVEVIRMASITREWVEEVTECDAAVEKLREAIPEGKGAILCIPHMGSWDMAGLAIQTFGFPLFFLVGRQHNEYIDRYTNELRGSTGIETIPRGDAALLRKVIRNLKQGKVLGFMTDLRSRTKGVSVQFLGKEANLVAGMALFARQANVPIIPAIVYRDGWAKHRWEVCDPVLPDRKLDKEVDFQRMTQKVMSDFEAAVRREPAQYFWFNNRWVLKPFQEPESDPVDLPSETEPITSHPS